MRLFVSEKTARCFGIIYAVLPSVYFLTPVLTNQHLSNLLIFWGIYLYASSEKKVWNCVIIGALLALGNAVRPTAIIAVVAIAVFEILNLGFTPTKALRSPAPNSTDKTEKTEKTLCVFGAPKIKAALITAASYAGIFFALSFAVKISGLNPNGLENAFPAWKFIVGLNRETGGMYSFEDEAKIYSIPNPKERDKKAMETLKERIFVSPPILYNLFMSKIKKMWCDFDSPEWAFYNYGATNIHLPVIGETNLKTFLQKTSAGFNAGIFILLAFACAELFKKNFIIKNFTTQAFETQAFARQAFETQTLLSVVFLIYFGVHLFAEIQPRYRDFASIPIFALSASGFEYIFQKFKLLGASIEK
jgi:hypothetical protein